MLRLSVLASGSKGNASILTSTASGTSILVDAGLSCRETLKRMKLAGEDPAALSAILITHEHQDHVNGLGTLARKLNIPVYVTGATHSAWKRMVGPKPKRLTREQWFAEQQLRAKGVPSHASAPAWQYAAAAAAAPAPSFVAAMSQVSTALCEPDDEPPADPTQLPQVEFFQSGRPFSIHDIGVMPFTVPHDAADPVGFVFTVSGLRFGLVTDLGYIPPNVSSQLRRCDLLYLESNHDIEMLRTGPYPWSVKQRVLSRVGHLSNDALADYLATDYDGSAAVLVLAHLSESNNHPDIARTTAERALGPRANLISNRLVMAQQDAPTPAISL